MDQAEFERGRGTYFAHLKLICSVFNDWAAVKHVPVRLNATDAIEAIMKGSGLAQVAPFWSRLDDTGVIHEEQLKTAIDCFTELLRDSKRCGHVVGAMQSGKTTTSLALQWAGPVLY